jgi:hypothetical protein
MEPISLSARLLFLFAALSFFAYLSVHRVFLSSGVFTAEFAASSAALSASPISSSNNVANLHTMGCWNTEIANLARDPCYSSTRVSMESCACPDAPLANRVTYLLPSKKPDADAPPLSAKQLKKETVFVFIHANKAAGETIKQFFFTAMERNGWDGAALGSRVGWSFRGSPASWAEAMQENGDLKRASPNWNDPNLQGDPLKGYNRGPAMYAQCGVRYSTFEQVTDFFLQGHDLTEAKKCPFRFVWGNSAMGLCDHFKHVSCVYVMALRDPLQRALSDYRYFCLEGAENRKKWTPEWIRQDKCTASAYEWFRDWRTSPHFYIERLTRSCDARCGAKAAVHNLLHPCMRYLLVDRLEDGLMRLAQTLGPGFADATQEYKPKQRNSGHVPRRAFGNSTLFRLKDLLTADYEVYDQAVEFYEEQWKRPLVNCS